MKIQKAMAIASHVFEAMARNNLHCLIYRNSDCLPSQIDYLLAGFLFVLQDHNLSSPEQATALIFLDRLLRLKIDLKRAKGVNSGY